MAQKGGIEEELLVGDYGLIVLRNDDIGICLDAKEKGFMLLSPQNLPLLVTKDFLITGEHQKVLEGQKVRSTGFVIDPKAYDKAIQNIDSAKIAYIDPKHIICLNRKVAVSVEPRFFEDNKDYINILLKQYLKNFLLNKTNLPIVRKSGEQIVCEINIKPESINKEDIVLLNKILSPTNFNNIIARLLDQKRINPLMPITSLMNTKQARENNKQTTETAYHVLHHQNDARNSTDATNYLMQFSYQNSNQQQAIISSYAQPPIGSQNLGFQSSITSLPSYQASNFNANNSEYLPSYNQAISHPNSANYVQPSAQTSHQSQVAQNPISLQSLVDNLPEPPSSTQKLMARRGSNNSQKELA